MNPGKLTTRELLIVHAGELFAEHGFDKVSTRMIADKAEVKLSSIHYHFGSKENLYLEACLYAHGSSRPTTFADVCDENPNLLTSREGLAEIVRSTVFRTFHDHFRPDRPEWESKIFIKEISNPSNAMRVLAEKVFKPDTESAEQFYKRVNPEATGLQAAAWADLMYGKIILYCMAKHTIELVRGEGFFNQEFYMTSAASLARAMILEAGLPLPTDLQIADDKALTV